MAALKELLGDKLVSKAGEVATSDAIAGKGAVALYFSAHWCPPCRGFTPQFAGWYQDSLRSKGLEVIFVSSDKDEDAFKEYFEEMPWLGLPFSDRARKDALNKKFKVNGIPSVVILAADGSLITKDGREAISSDPVGEDFPWKPKSFREVFGGAKLLGPGGAECTGSSLEGKVLALYFSAHWCPPCRGFTPKLAEWYSQDLKKKGLEVVFLSSDKTPEAFQEYFGEMPWLALDYSDRKRKEQLSSMFGVSGIPSMVIIDKDGSTINKDGRAALSSDPTGERFPWYPKPVFNLSEGPGCINETPMVIALCETSDQAVQQAIEETMTPIAKRFVDDAKARGEDPSLAFGIGCTSGGISSRLRSLMGLPALPPSKHEHPLNKMDSEGGWGCDGCGKSGAERYRCSAGCDFDYCEECDAAAGSSKLLPPKLMLIDIPDDGGYYDGPEGDVTAEVLAKFVADYQAKGLQRKKLEG
mmetsp:Transcript_67685/g.147418  ORF Transcript_67685/g.147418 Transcript_67685/m.147418 type:complete len:470 (+) Transcript_67685:77-1486(+)